MAVFGAPDPSPDHARSAIQAAHDMHLRQRALDDEWAQHGLAPFGLGIGLSTGEVAAALLGSDERVEYTLVGDTVNLAQRMQDLARPSGTVAAEATVVAASSPSSPASPAAPSWPWKPLGPRQVKGRSTPVNAYHLEVS